MFLNKLQRPNIIRPMLRVATYNKFEKKKKKKKKISSFWCFREARRGPRRRHRARNPVPAPMRDGAAAARVQRVMREELHLLDDKMTPLAQLQRAAGSEQWRRLSPCRRGYSPSATRWAKRVIICPASTSNRTLALAPIQLEHRARKYKCTAFKKAGRRSGCI
jgi:hypothetical protein